MTDQNKILFKKLKSDRKVKEYKNRRKLDHGSECEIGNENREMKEWIAEMSCYKPPKKRLPRDKDVFI